MDGGQRPLRILRLVLRHHRRSAGGAATYAHQLGTALAHRGHEFHLLACGINERDEDFLDGLVHVHLRRGFTRLHPTSASNPSNLPLTRERIYWAISHLLAGRSLARSFDIVESPEFGACGVLLPIGAAQALVVRIHTPVAVEAPFYSGPVHHDVRLSDWLERAVVRRATTLTAATRWLPSSLRERGWLPDRDVHLVRNPTDFDFWRQAVPVLETGPVVLAVGRVEPRKAPEVLVRAVARLRDTVPGLQAIFLGRSNDMRDGRHYRDWVRELASELGAPCRFLDEVPREELPGIFGQARVVAIPSWQEGFSNVGLEAMASGRPVVCTSNTGIAEMVSGTAAGAVVAPGDDQELALALEPYLVSPEQAAEAGRHAINIARSECAPEVVARQAEEAYFSALQPRRRYWRER
jgi:glycosyltransferase involved in cell wall biosynthesis